jgi:hypothetical protein
MKMNQINWSRRKLANLVPTNPEKKGEEMTAKMDKEVVGVVEEEEGPCNHICKVLGKCQDRCSQCHMGQGISEPLHFLG